MSSDRPLVTSPRLRGEVEISSIARISGEGVQVLQLASELAERTPTPALPRTREREKKSKNLLDPVMRVGRAAVLDVDQLLAHPHRDRACRAAADEEIAASRTHLADRRDH